MKTQKPKEYTTRGIQIKGQRLVSASEKIDPGRSSKSNHTDKYPDKHEDMHESRLADADALAVILGQLLRCLGNRANADDVDVLSFSLHHLFRCVDFLYDKALPNLASCTTVTVAGEHGITCPSGGISYQGSRYQVAQTGLPIYHSHQCIWPQLQTISRTLHRVEPICHLLSDAIEGILDTLDITSERIFTEVIDQEQWNCAFNALYQSLKNWQQSYYTFVPFATVGALNGACRRGAPCGNPVWGTGNSFQSFAPATPSCLEDRIPISQIGDPVWGTDSHLRQLDVAFTALLEGASMIFGDILPACRTLSPGNDEATATLLFDLIQQSDQLLVQLDATLEPLNILVEDFTLGTEADS